MQQFSHGDFLQWLRTFISVAETGSIHRAASLLCISPPAVSQHIRKLEDDLSIVLFERKSKGMQLTQAGLEFRDSGLPVLDEVEKLRGFKKNRPVLRGVVRLTCINSLAHYIFPDTLEFRKLHPEVTFSLDLASPARVLRNIETGLCDLAVTIYKELPGHMKFARLRSSSAYLYTPPGNPFALPAQPSWDAICELPFVALTLEGYVNPVISVLPDLRAPGNIVLAVNDFMLALEMVKAGVGVCISPPLTPLQRTGNGKDKLTLFNIDHIFPVGSFGLLLRREGYLPTPVRAFIAYLKQQYLKPHRLGEADPPVN